MKCKECPAKIHWDSKEEETEYRHVMRTPNSTERIKVRTLSLGNSELFEYQKEGTVRRNVSRLFHTNGKFKKESQYGMADVA